MESDLLNRNISCVGCYCYILYWSCEMIQVIAELYYFKMIFKFLKTNYEQT